jgi:hypothetical protein
MGPNNEEVLSCYLNGRHEFLVAIDLYGNLPLA